MLTFRQSKTGHVVIFEPLKGTNDLKSLLDLNLSLAGREDVDQPVIGPGLPSTIKSKADFVTADCIEP